MKRETRDDDANQRDVCGRFGKCANRANPPHTCPFAVEIHDDHRKCTCCDECTHECRMDI